MKIFVISLLFSTLSIAAGTRPSCKAELTEKWFEPTGFHKSTLFAGSAIKEEPIEITVTIQDWKRVQTEPERANAHSNATFSIGDVKLEGSVQARGQSRFNLFRTRALSFIAGDSDLKVVNRNGGFKSQPKLSSTDQNARVLVEYLIYKIHEVIFNEESVRTRLGIFTYVDSNGKILDKGYGFFAEGKGQLAKRLDGTVASSWDFKHDSTDAISGNIFRKLIIDGDEGNMINNFVYYKSASSPEVIKRIAYDFDYSYLAPPQQLKQEGLTPALSTFRQWLETSYELGTTGDHQYPPILKGTKAQKAQALKYYREQMIKSAQIMTAKTEAILTTIPWELLPKDYQVTMKTWFEKALSELKAFIDSHKN